jgi:hypothetical protein
MLKQRIDKTAFDALPDVMKAEYKPNPANAAEYVLDTEEAREAIAARDREKKRADELQAQIDQINAQLAEAKTAKETAEVEAAKKRGDVTALETSWQKKLDDAVAAKDNEIKKLTAAMERLLVHDQAMLIASQISTVPELLAPQIAARLQADLTGETPTTRVLDGTGKPSATTIDELSKEFVANPKFAAIIKASDGSGGGAGNGPSGGGASRKKLSDMSEQERIDLNRTNPSEFQRLQAEARAAAHR